MNVEELEAAALLLDAKARARLAGRLIESLDQLTSDENARIWVEEAQRRSAALDAGSLSTRPAAEVFRDARVSGLSRARHVRRAGRTGAQ